MPGYYIRTACDDDLESIESCAVAAYSKYIKRIGKEPAPMVADFAQLISDHSIYVLGDAVSLVGFVVFYPINNSMHLENVAVLPEHSGQGFGRLLIDHVEVAAARSGLPSVFLYTNEAMTENLSLYLALGYHEYERRVEDGFKRIYFRKLLQ